MLHGQDHARVGQDVALDGVPGPVTPPAQSMVSAPVKLTELPWVSTMPSCRLLMVGIPGDQAVQDLGSAQTGGEQGQTVRTEGMVHPGLGGDGADAGLDPGDAVPDERNTRGHGDAQLPVDGVAGGDGEGGGPAGAGRIRRGSRMSGILPAVRGCSWSSLPAAPDGQLDFEQRGRPGKGRPVHDESLRARGADAHEAVGGERVEEQRPAGERLERAARTQDRKERLERGRIRDGERTAVGAVREADATRRPSRVPSKPERSL